MNNTAYSVWSILRKFLLGWLAAGGLLVIYSCIRYRVQIAAVIRESIWGMINGVMPILIILGAIGYILRSTLSP